MDFGICKNGWSGPEYNTMKNRKTVLKSNQEVLGTVDIKIEIFQGDSPFIVCDHYDTTVTDSKGHKSWLPTKERTIKDQSPAIYG